MEPNEIFNNSSQNSKLQFLGQHSKNLMLKTLSDGIFL